MKIKKNNIKWFLLFLVVFSACGLNDTDSSASNKEIIPLKKGNKWVHYQTFTKKLISTEVIGEQVRGEYVLYEINNLLFGYRTLFYKSDSLYGMLENGKEELVFSPNSQRYFPDGMLTDTTITVPVGVYKDPLALGQDLVPLIEGNETILYLVKGIGPIKGRMQGDYSAYGFLGELELVDYEIN